MSRRRTYRDYTSEEIAPEKIEHILHASTYPPSGAGLLPFNIVVVKDPIMKQKIRIEAELIEKEYYENVDEDLKAKFVKMGIDHTKPFLTDAPALLVIAGDTTKPYWRESTWISAAYMLLAIEDEGLGTVTYTPDDTTFMNRLLDIPDHISVEVILPIGYPKQRLGPKKDRSKGRVHYERYVEK